MSDKLLKLCELQLSAVLDDLDSHTAEVSEAAGRLLRLCNPGAVTSSGIQQSLLCRIDAETCRIVTGLQFHDELAQRISHVIDLLRVLREEPADGHASEELLGRVCAIFSSQAEFRELTRVFPERQTEQEPLLVELFAGSGQR